MDEEVLTDGRLAGPLRKRLASTEPVTSYHHQADKSFPHLIHSRVLNIEPVFETAMRLTPQQIQAIHHPARQVAGESARVRVFGSRLDDTARGGDLDLMIELIDPVANPALLAARLSAKVSRALEGRRVDVLISAPNLRRLPIHDVAYQNGVLI